jgi:uncharacterized protein YndB with AHSA1/START domain
VTETTVRRTDTGITFERPFAASRELVFAALTTPELLMRWWGPRNWPMASCSLDLKPGGIWHYCLRAADGREHWARAVYREIVPPTRISYAETASDRHGAVTGDLPPTLAVVSLAERAGITTLRSSVTFTSGQHLGAVLARGMREGFIEALDFLEDLLARQQDPQTRHEGERP